MTERNYTLLVATYDDTASAGEDFRAIKDMHDVVAAAVVLERDESGRTQVKEHGGHLVGVGTTLGVVGGIVVGLFAPPLLLTGVVGAAVGAGAGTLAKRHEEKKIGVEAEEWLPENSSALVAVVDDLQLDRVDRAVEKAAKKINKAIDKGDYDAVIKAVAEGDEKVVKAALS